MVRMLPCISKKGSSGKTVKIRCYRRSCNQHLVSISSLPFGGKESTFTTLEARIPAISCVPCSLRP